jgi:hypothetical protein
MPLFIPLEGENIICLANVIAMYKTDEGTAILKRDGSVIRTGFTPATLKKRQLDLKGKGDLRKEFIQ